MDAISHLDSADKSVSFSPFCFAGCFSAFPTYRESDGGHVSLGGLHQKVHPEVHQLLFGRRLLRAGLVELLVDQNRLHQRAQIPGTQQRIKAGKKIHHFCVYIALRGLISMIALPPVSFFSRDINASLNNFHSTNANKAQQAH